MKFLLIIFFVFGMSVFNSRAQQLTKMAVPYKELPGVKPKRHSLDIYSSGMDRKKPVIVFVHGGGWLLGDKATKIKRKVRLFTELDYVFVSVNYQLSSFFNKKVQYPAHINDVADAVQWVFDHIEKYGGDRSKIVLMGHSAGAQMISLLATSPEFLPSRGIARENIKGIISMDTEGYDVYGMCNEGVKIYKRIFGEDPEKWKAASPILHIKEGVRYPNFLIFMRGKPYRFEMANNFANKLKSAGTNVQTASGEPYGHFKLNNIVGSKKDTIVTPKILDFIEDVLQ